MSDTHFCVNLFVEKLAQTVDGFELALIDGDRHAPVQSIIVLVKLDEIGSVFNLPVLECGRVALVPLVPGASVWVLCVPAGLAGVRSDIRLVSDLLGVLVTVTARRLL